MSDVDVVWHRGVPWLRGAMTSATADGLLDPLTELAREFRDAVQYDPGRIPPTEVAWVERGGYTVGVNRDLIVVGHERPGKASSAASDDGAGPEAAGPDGDRPKGRGPRDYDELTAWLVEAGYQVVVGSRRREIFDSHGVRRVTLPKTPDTHAPSRGLRNDTAVCRRVLGIPLRRQK